MIFISQFLFVEATVGSNVTTCTSLIKYDLRTDPEGSICPCSVAECGAVDSAMNGDCIILKFTPHLPLFRPLYLIGYSELGHIKTLDPSEKFLLLESQIVYSDLRSFSYLKNIGI